MESFDVYSIDNQSKRGSLNTTKLIFSKFSLICGIMPYYDYMPGIGRLLIMLGKDSNSTFVKHETAILNSCVIQEAKISNLATMGEIYEILSNYKITSKFKIDLRNFVFPITKTEDLKEFKEYLGFASKATITGISIGVNDITILNKAIKGITNSKIFNNIELFMKHVTVIFDIPTFIQKPILFGNNLIYSLHYHDDLSNFKALSFLDFSSQSPIKEFETIALGSCISANDFDILKLNSSKSFKQTLRNLQLKFSSSNINLLQSLGRRAPRIYPKLQSIHAHITTSKIMYKLHDVEFDWNITHKVTIHNTSRLFMSTTKIMIPSAVILVNNNLNESTILSMKNIEIKVLVDQIKEVDKFVHIGGVFSFKATDIKQIRKYSVYNNFLDTHPEHPGIVIYKPYLECILIDQTTTGLPPVYPSKKLIIKMHKEIDDQSLISYLSLAKDRLDIEFELGETNIYSEESVVHNLSDLICSYFNLVKFKIPIVCGLYRYRNWYRTPVKYKPLSYIRIAESLIEVEMDFNDTKLDRIDAPMYNEKVKIWKFYDDFNSGTKDRLTNTYKFEKILPNLANPDCRIYLNDKKIYGTNMMSLLIISQ